MPDGVLEQLVAVLLLHDEPRGADDFADVAYNLRLSGKSLSTTTIMVQHVLKGGVHLYGGWELMTNISLSRTLIRPPRSH